MQPIVVVDYDPSWPGTFERLRAPIAQALADIACVIEHVGSTSVPGLAAKPVIDLDVIVTAADLSEAITRLRALGYLHLGDLGVPGREAFRAPAGAPAHHLYLCPHGSPTLANHLAIRDHLRSNAAAAAAYGTLKKRLARQFAGDLDGYLEARTGFIVDILRRVGFSDDAVAAIERMNQRPLPAIIAIADAWWAQDFACSPRALRPAHARVQAHAGQMRGNPGIWILALGDAPLVSLPADLMSTLGERAASWSSADVADGARLRAHLGVLGEERIDAIVGPAFIGYAAAPVPLHAAAGAGLLTSDDHAAVERLRRACAAHEWEHGGSDVGAGTPLFGVKEASGELSALAGYTLWNERIAHIAIVSHPQRRDRGLARAAVALAVRHARSAGLIAQYRTLCTNTASMRIAERLGFVPYGFSVYVRIKGA